jgi:lipoyl(octanoyl) transferase
MHFSGIIPCGISASHFGVTSLRDLGVEASMSDVDQVLRETYAPIFGATVRG